MPDHPEHIVRLTSRPNEMEAGIIVATLAENGIRATATGAATAGFRAEAPGWVHVLVAKEDLPLAETVLKAVGEKHDAVDWSQVDVGEREDDDIPDQAPGWTRRRYWTTVGFLVAVILVTAYIAIMLRVLIALVSEG